MATESCSLCGGASEEVIAKAIADTIRGNRRKFIFVRRPELDEMTVMEFVRAHVPYPLTECTMRELLERYSDAP